MSKCIVSTLGDDTAYATFGDSPRRVLVRKGARTEVSDADAEFLANHGIFKQHRAAGCVKIEDIASDP